MEGIVKLSRKQHKIALGIYRGGGDGLVFHGPKGDRLSDRRVLGGLQGHVIEALKDEFPTPAGEIGFASGTIHGLPHFFAAKRTEMALRMPNCLSGLVAAIRKS